MSYGVPRGYRHRMDVLLDSEARVTVAYAIIAVLVVAAGAAALVWRRRRHLHKLRQSGNKKYDPLYSKRETRDA